MIDFLKVFQHLLPRGKAWRIIINKNLRLFFESITPILSGGKNQIDAVWLDIFPDTTRCLDEWEQQFALLTSLTDEDERRARLDAAWKELGGQSPRYIQDTLRNAGFDVYVHEWWEPGTKNVRNPLLVLNDGNSSQAYLSVCGNAQAVCGNMNAVAGATNDPKGYPLVNKIFTAFEGIICAGYSSAVCGNSEAVAGANFGFMFSRKGYIIPTDPDKWPYFWYVGGENYPDLAQVPSARRDEFEDLMLKIAPQQHWIGVLVEYV